MVGSGGVGKSALTLQFMYDEVSDAGRRPPLSSCLLWQGPLSSSVHVPVPPRAWRITGQTHVKCFLNSFIKGLACIKSGLLLFWLISTLAGIGGVPTWIISSVII